MIGEINMDNNLTVKKKKSELNAKSKEIAFLSYHHNMLVNCIIEELDDDIVFSFDTVGLKSCSEIYNLGNEKYRFLANCADLSSLYKELDFTLDPENIMYDLNLNPAVLIRDKQTNKTEVEFLHMYKSLCGAIINSKYKYVDYENGGKDLFGKSDRLKKIASCDSVANLKDYLIETYNSLQVTQEKNKINVNKKRYSALRILIPLLSVLALAAGIFVLFAYVNIIPYQNSLIEADNAYYKENYIEVQNILENIDVDKMPLSQKFILSRSFVFSESMTKEQKTNVLNGITMNTDEAVMDYWIYIGRLDFDNAVDVAQKIDDNELLIYAYIKQLSNVKDDTKISGEEKAAKVKELEEKIAALESEISTES